MMICLFENAAANVWVNVIFPGIGVFCHSYAPAVTWIVTVTLIWSLSYVYGRYGLSDLSCVIDGPVPHHCLGAGDLWRDCS